MTYTRLLGKSFLLDSEQGIKYSVGDETAELQSPQQQIKQFYSKNSYLWSQMVIALWKWGCWGTLYNLAPLNFFPMTFFLLEQVLFLNLLCADLSLESSNLRTLSREACNCDLLLWKLLLPLNSCMQVNAAVARCCLFTADKLSQWESFISSMPKFIKYSLEQWFELTYPCSLLYTGP